jgi:pancreatic lipase-related protein 2
MNIFYVDWFNLSSSICYPTVVHSVKHVGECTGQLIRRIRDTGSDDVHVIGFSLGAQVINYVAESLKPDFLMPHVTGLDPALPGFITVDDAHKLDASDAHFVDVYHCNVRAFPYNFDNAYMTLIFVFLYRA